MKRQLKVFIIALTLISTTALEAQDWPQWRGPDRDAVASAFNVPTNWPDELNKQWSVDVGLGYATPVLIGDRLYLFSRQDDDEVMTALDADTGSIIWRTSYAAPLDKNHATARQRDGTK